MSKLEFFPEELTKNGSEVAWSPETDDFANLNIAEKAEKTPVQLELEDAIAKAKVFHPVTKLYVDGYTGEVNRYKTPDNYVPDEGVVNDSVDLCHTEEHISISQIYARLKSMRALSISDGEYAFDEGSVSADDLEDDTISDMVDVVDDPSDYDNGIEDAIVEKYGKANEQQESDSAGQKEAVQSKVDDKAPEVAAEETL